MLDRIQIEAFKSLENVEVALGRVNVFIGANGSGKSNLLEAIGVLGAAAGGRVDDEALLRRGVRPGLPVLYKTSFRGERPRPSIRLVAETKEADYAVELLNPLQDPNPAWGYKTELLNNTKTREKVVGRSPASSLNLAKDAGYAALKQVELKPDNPTGMLLRFLRDYAIYSPDTGTLRGLRPDPQSREPVGLAGGRLAEALAETRRYLSKRKLEDDVVDAALDMIDWAKSFEARDPTDVPLTHSAPRPSQVVSFQDRYMAQKRNRLSGYDASEGALFVLFMLVVACHPAVSTVLAVDNFDQALNPRLARALTRAVCEWNAMLGDRQLLLTSHNPLVLDGLPLRDDSVRLFAVERSSKGKTLVQRVQVSDKILKQAQDGVPLSQQWVIGTFGGVPNI